ncbi:MAG: CRTAC1 family protein [Planctomycetes bacterium]|nr:CRTAC1 family protein [Planctomycetota bacterium]
MTSRGTSESPQAVRRHAARCLYSAAALGLLFLLASCTRAPVPVDVAQPSPAENGPPFFHDVTSTSGVNATYRDGQEAGHYAILESLGGGIALFDFDNDGLLDIFIPGGGDFGGPDKKEPRGLPSKLYRNLGNLKFEDVTAKVMAEQALFYTHGCAVADYDGDGWPDLLVTGWGRVALYHNEPVDRADPKKGRRLVERASAAGLRPITWATSAAWADLDGDGFPDLYLCQYVDWSPANNPRCRGYSAGVERDVCPPAQFKGLPHLLFRNNRDGTFTEIGKQAGLRVVGVKDDNGKQVDMGKGLGVVAADLNDDGRPDLYVANDTVDNFLYFNRGQWKLDESALLSGTARDDRGLANGSMGLAVGDYNQTGRASLFVTNYENEMHGLYRNAGREAFYHSTSTAGIAALGQKYVGFGTSFVDLDHHGLEDLIIANGHVIRHPAGGSRLKQAPVLLRNLGEGRFKDYSKRGGDYFKTTHVGRGLALGDLDNDGRLDVVISHVNHPVSVLRNIADVQKNHWLGLKLTGKKRRDLVGTKVTVEAAGKRWTRFVVGGGSYLSAHDPRLVIGLGTADRIDRLTIAWSHGKTEQWPGKDFAVDKYWPVTESSATPRMRP